LPTEITSEISYLAGFISGDGNLFVSEKHDYLVSLHNKDRVILRRMVGMISDSFGYKSSIKNGHGCYKVEIRSTIIHAFFNTIMEIESGRKNAIKIPEKIKSDQNLVRSFIAGFFDAEGSVHLQKNMRTCQLSFSQKQRGILNEVKCELEKDSIETVIYAGSPSTRTIWLLYGNKGSLRPFAEKIPFLHPKKRKKLMTALENS
jgi:DNA-binding transcriptional regulator WhiA